MAGRAMTSHLIYIKSSLLDTYSGNFLQENVKRPQKDEQTDGKIDAIN